jgi:ATPase subunit of ABC transporter with duplicated ATPase domains
LRLARRRQTIIRSLRADAHRFRADAPSQREEATMGNVTSKTGANGNRPARAPLTRAIALVGPAGTGKTSLAEALLFASGAITRQGSVEAGTTVGDASPEARARRGSTEINLMHFDYLGDRFALIDVPAARLCRRRPGRAAIGRHGAGRDRPRARTRRAGRTGAAPAR